MIDGRHRVMKHNSGSLQALKFLSRNGVLLSVISNTSRTNDYSQLIRMFGWGRFFRTEQFFVSKTKLEHVKRQVKHY